MAASYCASMATAGERRILGFLVAMALIGTGARLWGVERFEQGILAEEAVAPASGAARAWPRSSSGGFGETGSTGCTGFAGIAVPTTSLDRVTQSTAERPRLSHRPQYGLQRRTRSAPQSRTGDGPPHHRATGAGGPVSHAGGPSSRAWHRSRHPPPSGLAGDVFWLAPSLTKWGSAPPHPSHCVVAATDITPLWLPLLHR